MIMLTFIILLYYVYRFLTYVSIAPCVFQAHKVDRNGHQIPSDWRYKWVEDMWVLGIVPGFSEITVSAFNC